MNSGKYLETDDKCFLLIPFKFTERDAVLSTSVANKVCS